MEKKQGKINSKKLVKTVFWTAVVVLVLFFGKRLLPGDEADTGQDTKQDNGSKENSVSDGNITGKAQSNAYLQTSASGSWGLGFGADGSGQQPSGSLSKEELAKYGAWYLGDDQEKVIYLTFDCGYENGNTGKILDALKKHNAKATFFVVGHFLESAPDAVKRMAEEGHFVGNHTWHHLDMATLSDAAKFQEEMDYVAETYKEITGQELNRFYRPPQGKYSLDNLQMAQKMGYQTIFWSLAYVDWNVDAQPSREEAFAKLTGRIHPGAIVLLHNTSATNGEILDELLTRWEEMGYRFGTLEELTGKS